LQHAVVPREMMIQAGGDVESDQTQQDVRQHDVDVAGEESDFCFRREQAGQGDEVEHANWPVAGRRRRPAQNRQNKQERIQKQMGPARESLFPRWVAFDGYRHTVEHSVYVDKDCRGAGIGEKLMRALIERASAANIHVMIAGIEAENAASIKLHEKLGFRIAGTFSEVGIKFGRWLDLTCMELRVPKV